ncbi:MAG TPA: threonine synthase [Polyangia bacterium]
MSPSTVAPPTSFVRGMICRECRSPAPVAAHHVCEECFGPLDIDYDRDALARHFTRALITARPATMWRYAELLPLAGPPTVGLQTGMTPLVPAPRLARAIGVRELFIKNEAVSHPTLSFKDRVVAVALSKARELGLDTVACASTGNLGNATAALAAASGMTAVVFIPDDIEAAKVLATTVYGARVFAVRGTYDDVNRLSSEIADRYGWGFVNINLRPFYGEGSKTVGYEIAEQLGWRLPAHVLVPMAGGSLLHKIHEAFNDFAALNLVEPSAAPRMHGVQGAGCAPIAEMVIEGRSELIPIKEPKTIATSLAIGNPADAVYAHAAIVGSGGFAAAPTDDEIRAGMRLLAESEGIFGEAAGGVLVAALRHLVAGNRIGADDGPVVLCLTGQGLKTQDVLLDVVPPPTLISPRLGEFDALWKRAI